MNDRLFPQLVVCLLFVLSFTCVFSAEENFRFIPAENKIDYWNVQRKGANYFNQNPSVDWFKAAKEIGIQFARLATDKWKGEKKDFLIGDADAFEEIPQSDLRILIDVINQAQQHDVKIVLTFLSLPGSRWKQNNQNQDDLRIWEQKEYRTQAILFWKTLAKILKDHPAIVGYNILNEPHPECLSGINDYRQVNFETWHESIKHSLMDLNLFYREIVNAIREVDPFTPIIVDTGLYATPWAIRYLVPIEDERIIYSFHMYEPYAYTTRKINNKRFIYPGYVPLQLEEAAKENLSAHAASIFWNSKTLEQFLQPVSLWQKKYHIPASRILVGEFGCDRTAIGAKEYLSNLIEIFNANCWHWAFYSFREDSWDSMDYELGPEKLHWTYWEAIEQGASLNKFRKDNSLFEIIKNDLNKYKI